MALREMAMTAPFTQGSRWVLPHQCIFRRCSECFGDCHTSVPRNDMRYTSVFGKKQSDLIRPTGTYTL